jgi:hypothetical protein
MNFKEREEWLLHFSPGGQQLARTPILSTIEKAQKEKTAFNFAAEKGEEYSNDFFFFFVGVYCCWYPPFGS